MPANLIDPHSISAYLESFLPSDPQATSLLKLALGKNLGKRPENLQEIHELPEDSPDWLRAKWPEGGPYHQFVADSGLNDKVQHIADWLKVAVQNQEHWLGRVDNTGKPFLFININSLEEAYSEADKAMRQLNQKHAAQLAPEGEGEKTVMELNNGFRIVQLLTPSALDREGFAMGHCIGQGAYDKRLKNSSRQYFSLRDNKNEPHVSIEVDVASHAVTQCQGKENKPPVGKYLPYLQAYLRQEKYKLEASANHTGLVEADGEYHDIYNLPERLEVGGGLDLQGTGITRLPEGLKVGGNLYLQGTGITRLPEGLKVGGGLLLHGTGITRLPERLEVGGDLYLHGTGITVLPEGLKIGGQVYGLKTWAEQVGASRTNTNNVVTKRFGRT